MVTREGSASISVSERQALDKGSLEPKWLQGVNTMTKPTGEGSDNDERRLGHYDGV